MSIKAIKEFELGDLFKVNYLGGVCEITLDDPNEGDLILASADDAPISFLLSREMKIKYKGKTIKVGKLKLGDRFNFDFGEPTCELISKDEGTSMASVKELGELQFIISNNWIVQVVERKELN